MGEKRKERNSYGAYFYLLAPLVSTVKYHQIILNAGTKKSKKEIKDILKITCGGSKITGSKDDIPIKTWNLEIEKSIWI